MTLMALAMKVSAATADNHWNASFLGLEMSSWYDRLRMPRRGSSFGRAFPPGPVGEPGGSFVLEVSLSAVSMLRRVKARRKKKSRRIGQA